MIYDGKAGPPHFGVGAPVFSRMANTSATRRIWVTVTRGPRTSCDRTARSTG